MSAVSFVKIGQNRLKQAILDSLDLIHFSFPRNVENVVIKPNMCYYWDYSTGQTTDPRFVGALIDLLREQISPNIDISIVEADASAMKCKHAFRLLGYEKLSRDYNVKLVNLSEDKTTPIEVTVNNQPFRLRMPNTIQNADLKINATKIKYSLERIKITCALKNVFGCNPYPKKFRYHPKLEEMIVALNKAMRFDLCLVDGGIVSGIQPRRLGLVIASTDPVAIDAAAAKIAKVNPKKIRYIRLATKEGLGNLSFVEKGIPLSYFRDRYPKKDVRTILVSRAYNLAIRMKLGKKLGLE
ncbi:MAG TPA: DUF362 domain-containing protein [Candidatus Bathyarchaeia archaeon]|nr:DUF362 domain-containing protein [Candidatus Bathyarchaeia archaeon]